MRSYLALGLLFGPNDLLSLSWRSQVNFSFSLQPHVDHASCAPRGTRTWEIETSVKTYLLYASMDTNLGSLLHHLLPELIRGVRIQRLFKTVQPTDQQPASMKNFCQLHKPVNINKFFQIHAICCWDKVIFFETGKKLRVASALNVIWLFWFAKAVQISRLRDT